MGGAASGKIVVILNPASGRGKGATQAAGMRAQLERAARSSERRMEIVQTLAPGDATGLARRAAASGASVVAAAGGDGTISEVINGLVGTAAALAVLPLGTGNDFARHLGLAGDMDRAVDTLFHGIAQPLDLGQVGGRWFHNVAGCGFDAAVAARANRGYPVLRGTAAYLAAVIQCLCTFRAVPMKATVDGETTELRAMLCSIANASSYGGGMRIAPDARCDDGLFDICLLAETGTLQFLRAFPRVFRGTHITHPNVTMLRGKHVRIETERPMPVLVDGEVFGSTPADFAIRPNALAVLAPRRV